MKRIALFLILAGTLTNVIGQTKNLLSTAKEDINYYVEGEGGHNGLGITYNSDKGIYYMAMAGNSAFPLEVFNSSGKNLYSTNTKVDMRGFWYNSKKKSVQGTKYSGGAYTMLIGDDGNPGATQFSNKDGKYSGPSDQAVAVCNIKKKEIYSYEDGWIYVYNQNNYKLKKKIELKNSPADWSYINPYAMIFTGYSGYEFGVWDIYNAKVLFFNMKGEYKASSVIPGAPPYAENFCFAFCNDRVWLFDTDYRIWYSYIIFD